MMCRTTESASTSLDHAARPGAGPSDQVRGRAYEGWGLMSVYGVEAGFAM